MSPDKKERVILRQQLKMARIANHYTQAQIAKMLGITTRQYSRIEKGVSGTNEKVWQELRRLLKTPIDSLIEQ